MPKRHPDSELTIDELAMKHLMQHHNDKSDRILARMNRRFGRRPTDEAIERAKDVVRMIDPTNSRVRNKIQSFPTPPGWMQVQQHLVDTGLRAQTRPLISIIDECTYINQASMDRLLTAMKTARNKLPYPDPKTLKAQEKPS